MLFEGKEEDSRNEHVVEKEESGDKLDTVNGDTVSALKLEAAISFQQSKGSHLID